MTKYNSIVSEKTIQRIDSLSMTLLSMADCYDLPKSVQAVIQDLQSESESLKAESVFTSVSNKNVSAMKTA